MKIGILTFHSQQNYGGVLQCWALKRELEKFGHSVVVIDRWMDERKSFLKGPFAYSLRQLLKTIVRAALGCGDLALFIRTVRSIRFVNSLGLTKYHFVEWSEAPADLGVDCLIVGSDQVWNSGPWGASQYYLLDGAKCNTGRLISYAASFGMPCLPTEKTELFARNLPKFSAISCREKEGVEICRSLGFDAAHVVDPTLLVDPSCWSEMLPSSLNATRRSLACYFMSVNLAEALPCLEAFARANNCRVEVLSDSVYLKPLPKSFRRLLSNYRNEYPHVKICSGYGPKEFVRSFASATWTLTDSFHAVMFSSIFEKNLRFIKPDSEFRKAMFARIEEFAQRYITGDVFVNSVKDALDSFSRYESISYNRKGVIAMQESSRAWLEDALAKECEYEG